MTHLTAKGTVVNVGNASKCVTIPKVMCKALDIDAGKKVIITADILTGIITIKGADDDSAEEQSD